MKPLLALLLIYSLAGTVHGQGVIRGTGAFQIDFDFARFYGDSTQVYVEVYYGVREHIITYKAAGDQWRGNVHMKLKIWKDTSLASMKEWNVPHTITDTSILSKGKTLVGLETMGIPAGDYRMVLTAQDSVDPHRHDSISIPFRITSFSSSREVLSDIELCTSITPSTDKSGIFYKNTLNVIPNASMLYGTGLSSLYYYVEAYNMTGSDNKGDFIVQNTIVDGMGTEILRQFKNKKRSFNSIVDFGKIDVSNLRSGTFILTLTLTDSLEHIYATASKKFFMYRPGVIDTMQNKGFAATGDAASSEYALMTMHDVDSEFTVSRYAATDAERREYQNLKDLDAKRKFMFGFWRRRNPDPASAKNAFKIEYLRRIEYANRHFARGFREGWKTDRGRVYIMYGPYDELEENSNTAETNPYDIWHYNSLQGGVIFVFVDRNGLGQYQLMHSTHRDELHNESWYAQYAQKTEQ